MFSKGDTTNSFHKLYENTENVNDTIPSYGIGMVGKSSSLHSGQVPERYEEDWLKKTKLPLKEKNIVMKKQNVT